VQQCDDDSWMSYKDFNTLMQEQAGSNIESYFEFDDYTATVNVAFTNKELYSSNHDLISLFVGCTNKINYRITVIVPGSDTMGSDPMTSTAVPESFSIEIVDPTQATTCKGANLDMLDTTKLTGE
jgi:hypothetical protein